MKKLILSIFILFHTINLFGEERVLIVTTNDTTYSEYQVAIDNLEEKTTLKVELLLLENNRNDFSESINYLENNWANPPLLTYYIDNSPQKRIMIHGFNTRKQPDLTLIKKLLKSLFLESRVSREFPLYLTGIIPEREIIKLYRKYGYSAIVVEGPVKPETILRTLNISDTPGVRDTHYYIAFILGRPLYITESILLKINGIFLFLVIVIVTVMYKKLRFHLKLNKVYMHTFFLKITAIFLFYFISTLILEYIKSISVTPDIILNFPMSFFVVKNLILFFLYSICFQVIKDKYISRSPYIYANFSFYGFIITYLLIGYFYLPLALFFLWPIIATTLFNIIKNYRVKGVLLIATPIFTILTLYDFIRLQPEYFTGLLLNSRYSGNIILTFFITPYIFLQESFFRFIHRKQNKITHSREIVQSLLILTLTITAVAILLEVN